MKKEDYVYFGQYKAPLIYGWLLQKWAHQDLGKKYRLPKLDGRLLFLDGHLFIYKKDWQAIEKLTARAVKNKDKKFFNSIFKLMDDTTKQMLKTAKNLSAQKLDQFFKDMNTMEYPWFFVLPINEKLEKIIPLDHFISFFTPSKPTPLIKQQKEALALKKKIIKNKNKINSQLRQEINDHVQKYKWFGMMHMWGSPFSVNKFLKQLKHTSIKQARQKKINIPKELNFLQKQTSELSYWRNYIAEVCGIASYYSFLTLKKEFKKLGFNYDLGKYISPPEFLNHKIPSKKILQQRKKAYGLVVKNNKIIILTGQKLQKLIKQTLPTISQDNQLTGLIANQGKVKGRVKIVLSPEEIHKVKAGDIMIASETTPDFVPAAQRAAALVTDIGGITSHAAIISREIGIPCLVGTKFATRLFKDNDLIEVDAEQGKVIRL